MYCQGQVNTYFFVVGTKGFYLKFKNNGIFYLAFLYVGLSEFQYSCKDMR